MVLRRVQPSFSEASVNTVPVSIRISSSSVFVIITLTLEDVFSPIFKFSVELVFNQIVHYSIALSI